MHDDDSLYRRMIHSAQWARLRRSKLAVCPLCERCQAEGRLRAATEVHHVVPVDDAMSASDKRRLMFDPHNLRALCHDCHVQTHTEMGRSGAAQARRRQTALLDDFRRKFLGEARDGGRDNGQDGAPQAPGRAR